MALKSGRRGFPRGRVVNNPPANAGNTRDTGLIPGSGRSPGEGNGNPLQYSCLENSVDRGVRWATVHRVAKSWTRLSNVAHTHRWVKRYKGMELMGPKRTQQPYDPKCGPWTSRICIPWELVRNADAQAPAAELDGNMHCNKTPRWC